MTAQKRIDGVSEEKAIAEILELIQRQTDTLKNKPISPLEAALYRDRAWQIGELVRRLDRSSDG